MVRLLLHSQALQKLKAFDDELDSAPGSSRPSAAIAEARLALDRVLGKDTAEDSKETSGLPRGVVTHAELVRIQQSWSEAPRLNEVVRGAQVWFPPKKAFVRSPELEATLARIRLEQERSSYASMVSPFSVSHPTPAAGSASVSDGRQEEMEWQEVRSQISALANIALSGVAVGVATWWSSGQYTALELKVLFTAVTSIGIILIEAFLYARHFKRTKRSKEASAQGLKGHLTKGEEVVVIGPPAEEGKDT